MVSAFIKNKNKLLLLIVFKVFFGDIMIVGSAEDPAGGYLLKSERMLLIG